MVNWQPRYQFMHNAYLVDNHTASACVRENYNKMLVSEAMICWIAIRPLQTTRCVGEMLLGRPKNALLKPLRRILCVNPLILLTYHYCGVIATQ